MSLPVQEREAEFERVILVHRAVMKRTLWRVVRDPDLTEDLLQDVLTLLWQKMDQARRHANPRALVLKICNDHGIAAVRARLRRRTVPLDGMTVAVGETQTRELERRAIREQVRAAICRLGSRQATAVLLLVVHEESYETIAQTLNCKAATARVHVHRGLEKLRRWLPQLRPLLAQEDAP